MDEEMMNEHYDANFVQPGWKISEEPSTTETQDQSGEQGQQRAGWGKRDSLAVKPPAVDAGESGNLNEESCNSDS